MGRGRSAALADDVRQLAPDVRSIMVVADPALRGAGHVATIVGSLGENWRIELVTDITGEPSAADIDRAVARARHQNCRAVVGIGGGSVLDVAKMVAAVTPGEADTEEYQFCARPFPSQPLPLIAVPTTAGTGSEVTVTAVFTNAAGKKAWAWAGELKAAKVILDPMLTLTLPRHLTAVTAIDALVHAIEASSNRNRFAANDVFGHAAIRLICRNLPIVLDSPADVEARERLLLGSCLAGIAINNAGTAIAHCAAHAIGSLGKVQHGRAAGLGLRASLLASVEAAPDHFANIAEAMGGPRDAGAVPGRFDHLIRNAGIDVALSKDLPGVTAEQLAAEMGAAENASMRQASARLWSDEDLLTLARALLEAG